MLLGRVVDKSLELSEEHLKETAFTEELGTELGKEVRTMVTSVDCSEMRGEGEQVTRGRGRWWAVGVNEAVISERGEGDPDHYYRRTCAGVVKRAQSVVVSNNTAIVWRRGGVQQ